MNERIIYQQLNIYRHNFVGSFSFLRSCWPHLRVELHENGLHPVGDRVAGVVHVVEVLAQRPEKEEGNGTCLRVETGDLLALPLLHPF